MSELMRLPALFALALILVGCNSEPAQIELSGSSMGTSWHLSYRPPPEGAPGPGEVQAAVQAVLDRVENSMSTYRKESEISRLNAAPLGQWLRVSEDFSRVLTAAWEVGRASEGGYDVTVGPLVDLWGFGPADGPGDPLPDDQAIASLLAVIGHDAIEHDPDGARVRRQRPVRLDFSSIAKGYAVDQSAQWLLGQQISNFLVEVGGEMRLAGLSGRGDLWRVAIERPLAMAGGVAEALALSNVAVATSGDYRNFFEHKGRRYSHSIDPRTGRPVNHELVSVTVVHPSAMMADAWATALTVLGSEDGPRVARERGLAVYFIVREGDGFRSSHTAPFAQYLPASPR